MDAVVAFMIISDAKCVQVSFRKNGDPHILILKHVANDGRRIWLLSFELRH